MSLIQVSQNRQTPEAFFAGLKIEGQGSVEAARKLVGKAKELNLSLRDYVRLAVDPRLSDNRAKYMVAEGKFANGYEAGLMELGLPVRDDFDNGVVLQAASETFRYSPGTRALFPEVINDMVHWRYRQTNFESTDQMVAATRTISGVEMLSTVVEDAEADYRKGASTIAEGARIPVKDIKTSQNSVTFYKHGSGIRTTYEFERRVRLDLLTPFVARTQRELEMSKVRAATGILLNGDGQVYFAAPEVNQTSFDATAENGTFSWLGLRAWFVARARAMTPIDTVVGNWDAYIAWLNMFAIPTSNNNRTGADNLAASGFQVGSTTILNGQVNFVLSSAMPAGKLLGYSRADTLEELIEAGSDINENLRSVETQQLSYYHTINSGYKLAFGDTRSVYNFNA